MRSDDEIWDLWCSMPTYRDRGRHNVITTYRAGQMDALRGLLEKELEDLKKELGPEQ